MSQATRTHEIVSMEALVEYLKQKGAHRSIQYRRAEDDPPDYWLSIDGDTFAVEETSAADEPTIARIAKQRRQGTQGGVVGIKWEGEAQDGLAKLFEDSVETKRAKLEKKGVPQQCRKIILLFYDAYNFGDASNSAKALQRVPGYEWFHSIFRAPPDWSRPHDGHRIAVCLYSKEARWRA